MVVAFANGVDRLKKDGAPIEWIAPEPVIGLTFGTAVVKDAPPKTKIVPLPMSLAARYSEYFQTYRKVMGLK